MPKDAVLVDLMTLKVCHVLRTHGKNCHQLRSWCDHPLLSYSVLAADTLRDHVTLTFDLFTLVSSRIWRITGQSLHQGFATPKKMAHPRVEPRLLAYFASMSVVES